MRPIAMRCNQEQFDSIKDRLEYHHSNIDNFNRYPYLTNAFRGRDVIANIDTEPNDWNRTVYETFDANIFLQACDIEVEKVWKGSEMQSCINGVWFDCSDVNKYRLKLAPDFSKEIEALQQKAKANGMKVIINFEKI